MNKAIKEYLASIGAKGGNANTPAQQEARKKPKGGGRPRKADAKPESIKRREYRKREKARG